MSEATLNRAMLDDPDEDGNRLAYADWLDTNGHVDRAGWIRASCEMAQIPTSDPRWRPLFGRILESYSRCRPAWWEELSGVDQRNDRGMFRFVAGATRSSRSNTTIKQLGKVAWLGTAAAEGWLQRIELMWCDTNMAGTRGLMVRFHRGLKNGLAKDEALRQAMRAVAARREWSAPYYWAAFLLTGDLQNHFSRR